MAFPLLENFDHVISVSIAFPSNSQQDAPFHCIAYDYSCADWDSFQDHLRDFPCKDIFKSVLLLLQVNFMGGFRLELMYISLIKSIRSSLIRLHGFHLLVLMPYFIEITFFVCTTRINLLNLKENSDRLVINAKRVLEAAKLAYANKTKESITSQKLGSWDFW